MIAPVIPGLTEHELEQILAAACEAGAVAASWIALSLPLEVSPLFQDWLAQNEPGRAPRVMRAVRDIHGGRDYDPEWGTRMRGQGLWSDMMTQRFDKAVTRLHLTANLPSLRSDLFHPSPLPGDHLALF